MRALHFAISPSSYERLVCGDRPSEVSITLDSADQEVWICFQKKDVQDMNNSALIVSRFNQWDLSNVSGEVYLWVSGSFEETVGVSVVIV
jgi:hypothetical protein